MHSGLCQADTPSGVNVLTERSISSRSQAAAFAAAQRSEAESHTWPIAVPSRAELATAYAQGLDLCEGKTPGHAARVCYIALNLAGAVGLGDDQREAVYYAALLHEAGAVAATGELCRTLEIAEESLFGASGGAGPEQIALRVAPTNAERVVEALHAHPREGAAVAEALGFGSDVQEAIATHHEQWDGEGYPAGLSGEEIPLAGRLVAAADLVESLISTDPNPLVSRRNLVSGLAEHAGTTMDIELAKQLHGLIRSDAFWLGLHNSTLPDEPATAIDSENVNAHRSPLDLRTFATVFAGLGDAKGEHTAGHSEHVAQVADQIGEALGFNDGEREMLRIAALSHHVGLLGVPARVIAKPDILSLTEMETMRRHPTYSQMVLEAVPGLDELASWVGAHHERPDGKGYPEMLDEDMIPLEARIIAIADTYVALTSPRPYREALSDEDAKQVLQGGAGTQLDAELVNRFCSTTSSQSAPRSRRTR